MMIHDETRLTDLTVGEFKAVMRALVEDVVALAILEFEQQLPDPDEGLALRPELEQRLRHSLTQNGDLVSLEDVRRELKLDE